MSASDEEVRLTLRLPSSLRDRIAKEADKSGRSMNGEMVYRLEKTITDDDIVGRLDTEVAEIWGKLDQIEGALMEHSRAIFPNRHEWK